MEACKSSVRAKVEHMFFYVKQMFGYGKARYRSLAKNENGLIQRFLRSFNVNIMQKIVIY